MVVRIFDTPGALEDAIGVFVSQRAWEKARALLDDRERPDMDADDLYSRAVRACYQTLQRQVMAESRRALNEVRQ